MIRGRVVVIASVSWRIIGPAPARCQAAAPKETTRRCSGRTPGIVVGRDQSQIAGQRLIEVADRSRRVAQDARDRRDGRITCEGALARRQLVEHDAEQEDVRPVVNRFALRLLGRHVSNRAYDVPFARQDAWAVRSLRLRSLMAPSTSPIRSRAPSRARRPSPSRWPA